jgi:hypothetical protein
MKTLALNAYGVSEMSRQEMVNTDGGYAPKNDPDKPMFPIDLGELGPIIFDPRCW